MTDHLPIIGDYDDDDTGARQRGFWGLLAIALVAATIVAILGFVLDRKSAPNSNRANPNLITNFTDGASPLPSPTVSVPSTSPTPTDSSSVRASKTATPTPSRTTSTSASRSASRSATSTPTATKTKTKTASPTPTPTTTPTPTDTSPPPACANPCLSDGGALAAVNSRRAKLGLLPLSGTSGSSTARACASPQGGNCPAPNSFISIDAFDGAQAISALVALAGKHPPNPLPWFLQSSAHSVSIGWYYVGNGKYNFFMYQLS